MRVDIFHYVAVISAMPIVIMVAYQLFLAIGAFFHRRRSVREMGRVLPELDQYPPITILVPAHNEEVVIERTVRTLLALRYPRID